MLGLEALLANQTRFPPEVADDVEFPHALQRFKASVSGVCRVRSAFVLLEGTGYPHAESCE